MKKREIIIGECYNGTKVLKESERERYYWVVCQTCGRVYEERRNRIGRKSRCVKCTGRGRLIDLTGQRFGMLTVIGLAERTKATRWKCVCDCGKETIVTSQNLRRGGFYSCGCNRTGITSVIARKRRVCYTDETINGGRPITTHPLYACWASMIERCTNPKCAEYKNYGGRGISVCDRWVGKNGFENFVSDMGPKPDKTYSIDRIDVNGNYCAENCRWATPKEQCRNLRRTMYVFYGSNRLPFRGFCDKFNLPYANFYKRLKNGYDINFILEHFYEDFGSHEILIKKEQYRNYNNIIKIKDYEF